MKDKFLKHLEELGIAATDRLLLAVSGGHDSMVMVHLFQACNYPFSIAHVNFQLRGVESDRDEQFVKDWCLQNQTPFFTKRFETNNYAIENKLSIQMAARDLRYTWFDEVLSQHDFEYLVTAHHLNDSIETMLINLARGTGLEGMTGISAKSEKLLRPLMFATRTDLENYAAQNDVAWREDASNSTDDYKRNFIRHHIVPTLRKINPSFEETMKETFAKLKSEYDFLETAHTGWRQEFISHSGGRTKIKKSGLELPDGPAKLWHCLKDYGFRFSTCEDIVLTLKAQSGKQFLSNSHKLVVDRDFLELTPIQAEWPEVLIEKDQVAASLGPWHVVISETECEATDNVLAASLDLEKLSFPLVWRKWKAGDFFYPLGMEHRKKISDFLIDRKISLGEKDTVSVFESGGEIVWVAGYRIDNRFRLTNSTRRVITFTLSHI